MHHWLYEDCLVFNLVLAIKDQGYALTIDYIKKKQNGPWCLLMQLERVFFIIFILFSDLSRKGNSIKSSEIAR